MNEAEWFQHPSTDLFSVYLVKDFPKRDIYFGKSIIIQLAVTGSVSLGVTTCLQSSTFADCGEYICLFYHMNEWIYFLSRNGENRSQDVCKHYTVF